MLKWLDRIAWGILGVAAGILMVVTGWIFWREMLHSTPVERFTSVVSATLVLSVVWLLIRSIMKE